MFTSKTSPPVEYCLLINHCPSINFGALIKYGPRANHCLSTKDCPRTSHLILFDYPGRNLDPLLLNAPILDFRGVCLTLTKWRYTSSPAFLNA
jgi:hypothetical protein